MGDGNGAIDRGELGRALRRLKFAKRHVSSFALRESISTYSIERSDFLTTGLALELL